MTAEFDCSGRCRASGQCDCGAIVNDAFVGKRVVRFALALSDADPVSKGTVMQTAIIDAAVVDAEASSADYDWARGRVHVDGTPLERHYAQLNLMRASRAGQRVEAARDHYVDGLQNGHAPAMPATVARDSASAYVAMCEQLENAWR